MYLAFAELMQGRREPVYAADVSAAVALADRYSELQARDLLHVAVMNRLGMRSLVSADTGFDRLAAGPGRDRHLA